MLAGFPYWEVVFDAHGAVPFPAAAGALLSEAPAAGLTDVFVMSHGWNNDQEYARSLYARYFEHVRASLDARAAGPAPALGVVGVVWPSMRWADEPVPLDTRGGTASASDVPTDAELVRDLKSVFTSPEEASVLEQLAQLLADRRPDASAIHRFHELMTKLTADADPVAGIEDSGERAGLIEDDPERLFTRLSTLVPRRRTEGVAGLDDAFGRLWDGAKEALRQATYWQMKKRAGAVGRAGLGPLLASVHAAHRSVRLHLIGHSFGARLVSCALSGLPASAVGPASPVKSLLLVQGAFSHFAFADRLPHDPGRRGALSGMAARVDGPLVVTHTLRDSAVGRAYPLASLASRDDAAAADDLLYRWGAMGHDGAQAVSAAEIDLGAPGTTYRFRPGAFVNVNANEVIVKGGPPSGAHSDIFHPHLGWLTLAAAGLA